MFAAINSFVASSLFLVLLGGIAQSETPKERSDDSSDTVTILQQDTLRNLSPNEERVIEIEVTSRTKARPTIVTGRFERDRVMFGEVVGTPPEQLTGKPRIWRSKLKLVAPKHKGKYKFTVTSRFGGVRSFAIDSKPLNVEIK